jgi:hypothetical protein
MPPRFFSKRAKMERVGGRKFLPASRCGFVPRRKRGTGQRQEFLIK